MFIFGGLNEIGSCNDNCHNDQINVEAKLSSLDKTFIETDNQYCDWNGNNISNLYGDLDCCDNGANGDTSCNGNAIHTYNEADNTINSDDISIRYVPSDNILSINYHKRAVKSGRRIGETDIDDSDSGLLFVL